MKIISRSESFSKDVSRQKHRFGKYKDHRATPTYMASYARDVGIEVVSAYHPTPACPETAQPWFTLGFGMDNRRYLIELSYEQAKILRDQLDFDLKQVKPRRVK